MGTKAPASGLRIVTLKPIEATPESFKEYGQICGPMANDHKYGPDDAQLDLSQGTPRLYMMHLPDRQLKFEKMAHHARTTQCLGSNGGHVWYMGVAKASVVKPEEVNDEDKKKLVQSYAGHYYMPPSADEIRVFRISGPKFMKLNRGTWHAGPLYRKADGMDFYNLELADTNEVDFTEYNFVEEKGVTFLIDN
ncbi:unnamed protein product [Bemisia tabaci]|uniref:Ureidoglycolate hydrolase n=1 Tax=Bemisia tabaci TaxID=7038 RepID=A0A9P0AKM4_BEMTA|nr:unnamed protein product [Bemisia tabaci]